MNFKDLFCRNCSCKENSDMLTHAISMAEAKDDRKGFAGIHTGENATYECYITLKEKKHGKQTKRD